MDTYQCLKLISFFIKLSKNNMGAFDAPMLFFSKNKNYLSNQMHTTNPPTPHHITHPPSPHNTTTPPNHPSSPTLTTNPTHPTKIHPPTPLPIPPPPATTPPPPLRTLQPPTMEKKWGLNA